MYFSLLYILYKNKVLSTYNCMSIKEYTNKRVMFVSVFFDHFLYKNII